MTTNGGTGRTIDARLELLEYRAGENANDIQGLRTDMNKGLDEVNKKLGIQNEKAGRQLFATWMLIAALLSASAAIFAAVH